MNQFIFLALFAFPALALAQQPTAPAGVEGTILISPVMGGPTRQGEPDTKPLPQTAFVVMERGRMVTTFRTDAQGRFRVSLGAGHYSVVKKGKGAVGFFGPFEVDVAAGKMKSVQWKCDSGMR